ncbi:MAG: DUF559 domain-containing protein [Propionibacteriaceae bacterium]
MPNATPVLLPARPATREMLLRSGFSPQMIRTQLATRRLVRVRRGVFLAASAWPDSEAGRHLARAWAEQTMYEDAVMSHGTAALVRRLPHPGLVEWYADEPTVTLPREGGSKSRQGGVIHRLAELPPHHVTRDAVGFAVTTVARTAVDLVRRLELPQALVVLDGAARRLVESMVVEARRRDYANPGLAVAAREALEEASRVRRSASLGPKIALADPRRESAAESLSYGYFELAGLPRPLLQQPIRTPLGTFFPDFYWPDHRLIGECDGIVKYTERQDLIKEKVREDALREVGNRFVRWTGQAIMREPAGVVGRVARGLGF